MNAAARRTAVGAVLLVLAALAFGGRTFLSDGGPHSWDPGADPPATVNLTAGEQYDLSTAGGPAELIARRNDTAPGLVCTITPAGGTTRDLAVTVNVADTRVLHRIATFVSPLSGSVSIGCADTGAVFVDDANDSSVDSGTGLVLLCCLLALAGVAFLLSGLYGLGSRRLTTDRVEKTVPGAVFSTRSDVGDLQ